IIFILTDHPRPAATLCPYTTLFRSFGSSEECVLTDSSGEYALPGLPEGEHKVFFFVPSTNNNTLNYLNQYYNNKASFEEADPVTLAGGETKANINAALKAGGQISGKVTDSVSKVGRAYV